MLKVYRYIVVLVLFSLSAAVFTPAQAQLNTDRITAIGRNALYFEDYVLSIQYFNQVIRLKPYLSEPYFFRAIAKIQLEDYQGALQDCNAAITRNPFSPGSYYARGYIYRQLSQWEKAEADYTEALRFSPENRTYILLRADTRAMMKRYDEAMEDIDRLLHREPQSASIWSEKGRVAMLQGDTLPALEAFTHATEYDKTNPAAWSALGVTSLMLHREDEAYAQLTQAINLGSKWAGDYLNRGLIHYHRHNFRGALSDYDQAVKIAPRDADCYYHRAVMRQEVGDFNRALEDFNRAMELEPERVEMRYQRGLVEMQLKQWNEVVTDMDALIERYPYFLPAYYLAAQAKNQLGKTVDAYRYRKQAQDLEADKEKIQARQAAQPQTDLTIAQAQPQKKDYRKEFSTSAAQSRTEPTEEETQYDSQTRGTVQKRHQEVVNEPQIVLSYYGVDNSLRRTNYSHSLVDRINRSGVLPATLRFTAQEMALTAEMVDFHFSEIGRISQLIDEAPTAGLHFARAIEFAIVQDYTSAIDDCTKALLLSEDNGLGSVITFCRANWRYRLLEYQRTTGEQANTMDFEIMLRDYDQVILRQPDFAFALYNKANILCTQQAWADAIDCYSRAILLDRDFAEAYFNRGLTYVFIGENEKGVADLSKAGELGMYQAYNLITRFK